MKNKNGVKLKTPHDCEDVLRDFKNKLLLKAQKRIFKSPLGVSEIANRSGVARSKVSAIKNGAKVSMSCDLIIKVVAATN